MTEMKCTPGPWSYFYKPKYDEWHVALPVDGSQMKTALCDDGIQSANREADARLIAAAPEMAEALANLRAHVSFDARVDSQEKLDAMRAADAALKKAGG